MTTLHSLVKNRTTLLFPVPELFHWKTRLASLTWVGVLTLKSTQSDLYSVKNTTYNKKDYLCTWIHANISPVLIWNLNNKTSKKMTSSNLSWDHRARLLNIVHRLSNKQEHCLDRFCNHFPWIYIIWNNSKNKLFQNLYDQSTNFKVSSTTGK